MFVLTELRIENFSYLNTRERCIMESSVEEVIGFDIDHSQEKIANAPPLKNSP